MKKIISCFVVAILFLLSPKSFAAKNFDSGEKEARLYLSAWLALASYQDESLAAIAREEISAQGWQMTTHQNQNDLPAQFYFWQKDNEKFLLAIRGTSTREDMQTDINMNRVLFEGKNPQEFVQAMKQKEFSRRKSPCVHGGFAWQTQKTFFDNDFGENLAEMLIKNSNAQLLITGHSLGGAMGILLAARLVDCGVPSEQIRVVTFGAPAIGNTVFQKKFQSLQIDRVMYEYDPVSKILQSIRAGYKPLGEKIILPQQKHSERFEHEMIGYLDGTMRNYYAKKIKMPQENFSNKNFSNDKIFFAVGFDFDETLKDDEFFLNRCVRDWLAYRYKTIPFFEKNLISLTPDETDKLCDEAKQNGCPLVLLHLYESQRMKETHGLFDYTITLKEFLIDTNTQEIALMQMHTTNTKNFTPVLAGLYNAMILDEERAKIFERMFAK